MHPGDQANAVFVSVSFQTQRANGFRICQDRLKDDVDRNVLCMGKPLDNLLGMFGDLLKRLRTIEMLASGNEPHIELFQVDYHRFLPLLSALLTESRRGSVVAGLDLCRLNTRTGAIGSFDDEHNTESVGARFIAPEPSRPGYL
jgi:hypothetical protein